MQTDSQLSKYKGSIFKEIMALLKVYQPQELLSSLCYVNLIEKGTMPGLTLLVEKAAIM